MTTIFEFCSLANCCNDCFRSDALNFGYPLAGFRLPEDGFNFFIKKMNASLKIIEGIIKFRNCSAHSGTRFVLGILNDQGNFPACSCHRDTYRYPRSSNSPRI